VNRVVVDSSAVLALFWKESGAEVVQEALSLASISSVNVSEVVAKMAERGLPGEIIY